MSPIRFGGAFDVVAFAASAGGLSAISSVLAGMPAELPAALVIVQHLDPKHPSMMAKILSRHTRLHVKEAAATDKLASASVFIAPPNHHLLVNRDGTFSLTQSELVHFVRPSADLLFESVAASFSSRAIAVVLTGSDGNMGVKAINKRGGIVIAQSKETSEFSSMPEAAIQTGVVDLVLPLHDIAPQLIRLILGEPRPAPAAAV